MEKDLPNVHFQGRKFDELMRYRAVIICGCKKERDREYRPRGENVPVAPIVTGPGRWLLGAQRDALTRWLPEEQRQRAFAECALILDELIGPWRKDGPLHHCTFPIWDGVPPTASPKCWRSAGPVIRPRCVSNPRRCQHSAD